MVVRQHITILIHTLHQVKINSINSITDQYEGKGVDDLNTAAVKLSPHFHHWPRNWYSAVLPHLHQQHHHNGEHKLTRSINIIIMVNTNIIIILSTNWPGESISKSSSAGPSLSWSHWNMNDPTDSDIDPSSSVRYLNFEAVYLMSTTAASFQELLWSIIWFRALKFEITDWNFHQIGIKVFSLLTNNSSNLLTESSKLLLSLVVERMAAIWSQSEL